MNILTQIPDKVRRGLYIAFGVAAAFLGVCDIIEVESIASVTLEKWQEVLTYLALFFGVTAASNVGNTTEGDTVEPKDEAGVFDHVQGILVVILIFVVANFLQLAGILDFNV